MLISLSLTTTPMLNWFTSSRERCKPLVSLCPGVEFSWIACGEKSSVVSWKVIYTDTMADFNVSRRLCGVFLLTGKDLSTSTQQDLWEAGVRLLSTTTRPSS